MDPQVTVQQIGNVTLGGVGARNLTHDGDRLFFTISRGHRKVVITLDGNDTYHVQTVMIRSGKVVYDVEGIYCDQLAEAVWQSHIEQRA